MLNDPIADTLTRIRNAITQQHRYADIMLSKLMVSIVKVLKESGFINDYFVNQEKRKIRVYLKYDQTKNSCIQGLQRRSKPGRRVYVKSDQVPIVRRGLGIPIISTSKGIMSGKKARQAKIGGELLCTVW